jgi:hypothetical protein
MTNWPEFTPARKLLVVKHLTNHGFKLKSPDKHEKFLAEILRTIRVEVTPEAASTEKKDSHDKRESERILFG